MLGKKSLFSEVDRLDEMASENFYLRSILMLHCQFIFELVKNGNKCRNLLNGKEKANSGSHGGE